MYQLRIAVKINMNYLSAIGDSQVGNFLCDASLNVDGIGLKLGIYRPELVFTKFLLYGSEISFEVHYSGRINTSVRKCKQRKYLYKRGDEEIVPGVHTLYDVLNLVKELLNMKVCVIWYIYERHFPLD